MVHADEVGVERAADGDVKVDAEEEGVRIGGASAMFAKSMNATPPGYCDPKNTLSRWRSRWQSVVGGAWSAATSARTWRRAAARHPTIGAYTSSHTAREAIRFHAKP